VFSSHIHIENVGDIFNRPQASFGGYNKNISFWQDRPILGTYKVKHRGNRHKHRFTWSRHEKPFDTRLARFRDFLDCKASYVLSRETDQSLTSLLQTKYFAACMLGGIVACGPTHTAVTPLDLVKTRRQVDPKLYSSNFKAWRTIYAGDGLRGVFFGWAPTFVGYSFQGLGKYGFYEIFKHEYGDNLFPNANRTLVFLAASASAEFLADIFLCPFEAIKVRMQTTMPPYAHNLREGWSKVVEKEGIAGLYKGITPLWARQIPYTMCKFATFEETVKVIYKQLGKPKESYNKLQQTGVSFLGGYIAGIACAVVSHPADVMVSKLNSDRKRMSTHSISS